MRTHLALVPRARRASVARTQLHGWSGTRGARLPRRDSAWAFPVRGRAAPPSATVRRGDRSCHPAVLRGDEGERTSRRSKTHRVPPTHCAVALYGIALRLPGLAVRLRDPASAMTQGGGFLARRHPEPRRCSGRRRRRFVGRLLAERPAPGLADGQPPSGEARADGCVDQRPGEGERWPAPARSGVLSLVDSATSMFSTAPPPTPSPLGQQPTVAGRAGSRSLGLHQGLASRSGVVAILDPEGPGWEALGDGPRAGAPAGSAAREHDGRCERASVPGAFQKITGSPQYAALTTRRPSARPGTSNCARSSGGGSLAGALDRTLIPRLPAPAEPARWRARSAPGRG